MQKITKRIRTLAFALCLVLAAGFVLPFAANAEGPEPPVPGTTEPAYADYASIQYYDVETGEKLAHDWLYGIKATDTHIDPTRLFAIYYEYELASTDPIPIDWNRLDPECLPERVVLIDVPLVKRDLPTDPTEPDPSESEVGTRQTIFEYHDIANGEYLGSSESIYIPSGQDVFLDPDQLTNFPEGYKLVEEGPIEVPAEYGVFVDVLVEKIGGSPDPNVRHLNIHYIDIQTGEQIGRVDHIWLPIEDKFFDPEYIQQYTNFPRNYVPASFDPVPVPTDSDVLNFPAEPRQELDKPGYSYLRVDYGVVDPAFGGFHTISTERIIVPDDIMYLSVDQLTAIPDGYKLVSEEDIWVADSNGWTWVEVQKIDEPTEPETTEPSVPETTEPETTEPSVPETTEPEKTEPTVPEATKPEATEPSASETTEPKAEDSDVPDTGDETKLAVLTAATVITLTGAAAVVVSLKKNRI